MDKLAIKISLLISFVLLIGCNDGINYPEGGFDYPKNVADKDTNLYQYQLKDSGSKLQQFRLCYDYYFWQPFNEPNLSIRPQAQETFRLAYSDRFGSTIVSLNEQIITIKKGSTNGLYETDSSRLSAIERKHLQLLDYRFPFDSSNYLYHLRKNWFDSLTSLYPELLEVNYYHKLRDKSLIRNSEKFTITTTKIAVTKKVFISFVKKLNASGFWSLPRTNCQEAQADGSGYSFEANTKTKYKILYDSECPAARQFEKLCSKMIRFGKMEKKLQTIQTWDSIMVAYW